MGDLAKTVTGKRVGYGDLLACLAPVIDWYQPDDQPPRDPLDIVRDIVADLQDDRAASIRFRAALEIAKVGIADQWARDVVVGTPMRNASVAVDAALANRD